MTFRENLYSEKKIYDTVFNIKNIYGHNVPGTLLSKDVNYSNVSLPLNLNDILDFEEFKAPQNPNSIYESDSDNGYGKSRDTYLTSKKSKIYYGRVNKHKVINYCKNYVVDLHCTNEFGHDILIHVMDFNPYFHVKVPKCFKDPEVFLAYLSSNINSIISKRYSSMNTTKYEVKYFKNANSFNFELKKPFIKISIGNISIHNEIIKYLKTKGSKYIFEGKCGNIKIYNFNNLIEMKFLHHINIGGCATIDLKRFELLKYANKISNCSVELKCNMSDIKNINDIKLSMKKDNALICSFDIETAPMSLNINRFSQANLGDPVIGVGIIFQWEKDNKPCKRYYLTLKKSLIDNNGITEYISCGNEENLIMTYFANIMYNIRPDVILTYNGNNFDWKYLYIRSECFGITDIFLKMSRYRKKICKWTIRQLSSSAINNENFDLPFIPGCTNIDMIKTVRSEQQKAPTDKLKDVLKFYNIPDKIDLPYQDMFKLFHADGIEITINDLDGNLDSDGKIIKNKFICGSPAAIHEISKYCLWDAESLLPLMNKLSVLPKGKSLANLCYYPFHITFVRGSGIRVASKTIKKYLEYGYLYKYTIPSDKDKNLELDELMISQFTPQGWKETLLDNINNDTEVNKFIELYEKSESEFDEINELRYKFIRKVKSAINVFNKNIKKNDYEQEYKNVEVKINKFISDIQNAAGGLKELSAYRGAHVFTPYSGKHDLILVIDVSSMYPSAIMAFNLSHNTIIESKKILQLIENTDNNIPNVHKLKYNYYPDMFWRLIEGKKPDKFYEISMMDVYVYGQGYKTFDEFKEHNLYLVKYYGFVESEFNKIYRMDEHEYDNCYGKKYKVYTISHKKHIPRVYVDNLTKNCFQLFKDIKCKMDNYPVVDNNKQYAVSVGLVPNALREINSLRSDVKKELGEITRKMNTDNDPELRILYTVTKSREMAIKIVANSLYGCLGSSKAIIYKEALAALTTMRSREFINHSHFVAKILVTNFIMANSSRNDIHQLCEELYNVNMIDEYSFYDPVKYGDTDSIFVEFPTFIFKDKYGDNWKTEALNELLAPKRFGDKLCSIITKTFNKYPLEICREKVFGPIFILSKKRYNGRLYLLKPDGTIDMKGILKNSGDARKRGDRIKLVKYILGSVTDKLMNDEDYDKIEEWIYTEIKKVLRKEYPIEYFINSKSFKGFSEYNKNITDDKKIIYPVHVKVAKDLTDIMSNLAPNSGEKVEYVLAYFDPKINKRTGKLTKGQIDKKSVVSFHPSMLGKTYQVVFDKRGQNEVKEGKDKLKFRFILNNKEPNVYTFTIPKDICVWYYILSDIEPPLKEIMTKIMKRDPDIFRNNLEQLILDSIDN